MTDPITVREAEAADAARLLEIYAYYVQNTAITFEYDVPSLSEFQNRIRNTRTSSRTGASKATLMPAPL